MAKNKSTPFAEDAERQPVDTSADDKATEDAVNGGEEPAKKKYETMIVGVSKARKPTRDKLNELAEKLSCKPSDLIWAGVEMLLAKPPATAPAGASTNVGSAAGFWTRPVMDEKGKKAVGVKVTEVESRGEVEDGRTFFRFKRGDDKERARARNQAIRAAQNDAQLIGFKGEIDVEELETAST